MSLCEATEYVGEYVPVIDVRTCKNCLDIHFFY